MAAYSRKRVNQKKSWDYWDRKYWKRSGSYFKAI